MLSLHGGCFKSEMHRPWEMATNIWNKHINKRIYQGNRYSKRYYNESQIIGQLSMSMQRDLQIRKHNFDISTKIKQHIAKTGAFCIPAIVQYHKFQNPFASGVIYITPLAKAPPPHWHWSNAASIKL
jgi:hypothetical protein